jgi:hypothetical protein
MSNTEIEKRLADLEAEVALLKSKIGNQNGNEKPWYEKIAGTFADDPIYDEAMRLGREYRESQKMEYDEDDD